MAKDSLQTPAFRRLVVTALCIFLILLFLVATPVMAKNDGTKQEKDWPGQGVGPVKTDTPVPTTEPTTEPTAEPAVEQTPSGTAVATPETTPAPTSTLTSVALSAGTVPDEKDETVEKVDGMDVEESSPSDSEEWYGLLLLLLPAGAVVAAGAVIAGRRREAAREGITEPSTVGRDGGAPSSVRTVVCGTGSVTAFPDQPAYSGFPEQLAPKYRNIEYLGYGGIARVYRAEQISDGRVVAVKIPIVPDEQTGTHFMREIRFWERLHHPNILAIYSANILPVPYVEMEYAAHSLKDCPLPLSPEVAVRVIRGVSAGLSFAHGNGVIHRDIKPENILCVEDGTPKITDWGLGSVTDGDHRTQVGGFSPGYAAPEQLRPSIYGNEDIRTDLYQLGVLFFELLTGTTPFEGAGMGEMTLAVLEEPAPLPSESGAPTDLFDAVILQCLEKKKEMRYSSVERFCEGLRRAMGDAAPFEDG